MNILVSSCLLGLDARYCGTGCYNEKVAMLKQKYNIIPICPEQMGGLPTPRPPVELINGKAINTEGIDVTFNFHRGAEQAVKLAKMFNCSIAVLKSRSPSCGCGLIYDGTFSGKLTSGSGITAGMLKKEGVKVINEDEIDSLL